METQTVSNKMYSIIVLYDMHTDFFYKAIDGITDKDAHNRLDTKANHIAWLTGSLVHERYGLANELGIGNKQSANELFKGHKGIQDNVEYPSLDSFRKDWETISPLLKNALINVSDEQLDKPIEMPGDVKMNLYDLVAFMAYREANCIGQIALWRRLLGYEPLKYM